MKSGNLFITNTIIIAGSLLLSMGIALADPVTAMVSISHTSITSQGGMNYSFTSHCDANYGTVNPVGPGVQFTLASGIDRRADNGDSLLPAGFECTKPKTFKNNSLNVNASTPVITGLTASQSRELIRVAGIHGAAITLNNQCHGNEQNCEKYTTINNPDGSTTTVLKYTADQVTVTLPDAPSKKLTEYFEEAGLANFAREFTGNRSPSLKKSQVAEDALQKATEPQTADLVNTPIVSSQSANAITNL